MLNYVTKIINDFLLEKYQVQLLKLFSRLIVCISVRIVSATWKRLSVGNEPPPARAYHSMTAIGSRYLLIGGFDGKSTYGEPWWLVPQGIYCAFKVFKLVVVVVVIVKFR